MRYKRFLSNIVGASQTKALKEKLELPSFINTRSANDFFLMMSEWDEAKKLFELGAYSEAKQHITRAVNLCVDLEGITPFIVGTYLTRLSKFENEIESKDNGLAHKLT
ncbi:MAG: hypothetical protein K2X50_10155 [Gammaproteobacteria bacterium]|nr:hypothetical protein [Gammaproteobacteria bacterium]